MTGCWAVGSGAHGVAHLTGEEEAQQLTRQGLPLHREEPRPPEVAFGVSGAKALLTSHYYQQK